MEAFAAQQYEQGKGSGRHPFVDADAAFTMAFSAIMLNTDLHNPQIQESRRMSVEDFIRNNRCRDIACATTVIIAGLEFVRSHSYLVLLRVVSIGFGPMMGLRVRTRCVCGEFLDQSRTSCGWASLFVCISAFTRRASILVCLSAFTHMTWITDAVAPHRALTRGTSSGKGCTSQGSRALACCLDVMGLYE